MATKRHKNRRAIERLEAPIGAREIFAGRTEFFVPLCGHRFGSFWLRLRRFVSVARGWVTGSTKMEPIARILWPRA